MSPSDRHSGDSDMLVREVARQCADAAPPAPSWEQIGAALGRQPLEPTSGRRQLLLVAAVSVLLVSGIWALARQVSEPEVPSETIPLPTIPAPEATWQDWVAVTEPVAVQLCATRVTSKLSAESSVLLAMSDSVENDGGPLVIALLGLHRHSMQMLDELEGRPELDAETAEQVAEVAAAFRAASSGLYDDEGEVSADAESLVERFLVVRASSPLFSSQPSTCWLEGEAGAAAVASIRDIAGDLEAARCLAAAQFDHAASTQIADPTTGFGSMAVAAGRSLAAWFDPTPTPLVELVRQTVDAELLPAGERADALGEARRLLDDPALGLAGSCPLVEVSGGQFPDDIESNTEGSQP